MEARHLLFQRVLLNYFHQKNRETFVKFLPQEVAQSLLSQDVESANPQAILIPAEVKLTKIHYSWLIPLFDKMPEVMKPLIISILPESIRLGLSKHYRETYPSISVSHVVKRYFSEEIYKQLNPDEVLPIAYLPASTLNVLTELPKSYLMELINFLALFDLAEEMRHIVDQKNLKNLYSCLNPKQLQFLRICMHQKVKIFSPSLELDKWKGDCKQLMDILHRRGLYRLGTALINQHPDLIWHINHALDTGRASVVKKICLEKETSDVTGTIIQQVLSTMNFLKPKSK